jgi:hypothetical protein
MGEMGIICQATAMPGGCLPLDHVLYLFLSFGMVLLLRKSSAQARIEGWDPRNRSDDDCAVVDDTIVGRIYWEMILGNRSGGGSCNRSLRQVRGGRFRRQIKGWPIRWRRRRQRSPSVMRR